MNQSSGRPRRYWNDHTTGDGTWRHGTPPPGADLAALRRGAGRDPGTVASMWPFLRAPVDEQFTNTAADKWELPSAALAEHHALVLFGIHQQSAPMPVHREGVSLGEALRRLHVASNFSSDALDRRFYTMVTADSLDEVTYHLRSLIRLMRTAANVPGLDYDELERSLDRWQWPESRERVRRRWGLAYHSRSADEVDADEAATT